MISMSSGGQAGLEDRRMGPLTGGGPRVACRFLRFKQKCQCSLFAHLFAITYSHVQFKKYSCRRSLSFQHP